MEDAKFGLYFRLCLRVAGSLFYLLLPSPSKNWRIETITIYTCCVQTCNFSTDEGYIVEDDDDFL